MKHLRVETAREEMTLIEALELIQESRDGIERATDAAAMLRRLRAAPVARHGGVVHVEDANYLPTPGGRQ